MIIQSEMDSWSCTSSGPLAGWSSWGGAGGWARLRDGALRWLEDSVPWVYCVLHHVLFCLQVCPHVIYFRCCYSPVIDRLGDVAAGDLTGHVPPFFFLFLYLTLFVFPFARTIAGSHRTTHETGPSPKVISCACLAYAKVASTAGHGGWAWAWGTGSPTCGDFSSALLRTCCPSTCSSVCLRRLSLGADVHKSHSFERQDGSGAPDCALHYHIYIPTALAGDPATVPAGESAVWKGMSLRSQTSSGACTIQCLRS